MVLPVFSETWDTVRSTRAELASADLLLKLAVLSPGGAVLSTTHMIDSPLLLDCGYADDAAFLTLVQDGRLRVARWPDGQNPRSALATALGMSNYRLSTWPELGDPAAREAALAVWNGDLGSTGMSAVDERLSLADELYRSVEQWQEYSSDDWCEAVRDVVFGDRLRLAAADVPHAASAHVRSVVGQLARFEHVRSRGRVYDWLDGQGLNEADLALVLDMVDAYYNASVADSLGACHFSARRVASTMAGDYHVTKSHLRSEVSVYSPPAGMGFLNSVSWRTVANALAPMNTSGPKTREKALVAFETLAAGFAESDGRLVATGGGMAIAGNLALVMLSGGLAPWALEVLRVLQVFIGFGQARAMADLLAKRWDKDLVSDRIAEFSGWLDEVEQY